MSRAFQRALGGTGYFSSDGRPVQGLLRRSESASSPRLRPVLTDARIGLQADAVFSAHDVPTSIFKDSGEEQPSGTQIKSWHEAAWNIGLAPLLWIITPTEIRLYDCYSSPSEASRNRQRSQPSQPVRTFPLEAEEALRALNAMCGRLSTETGAFWSSEIGSKIDRRNRVDRQLLNEIKALEDELAALLPAGVRRSQGNSDAIAARDFAQRLIGRCIFTWYLLDRGIGERFLPRKLGGDLAHIFSTPETAFGLFDWLRETFDGDLFPMNDPGAERDRLGDRHLDLLQQFIGGWSLVEGQRGQGRLFRFRFDAIPVDLISSIYQQFARSSAADQARLQGLHYTPVELIHLTLDPVFEGLPGNALVIDPACGSGAFLVESFRRLVWKRTHNKPADRKTVRDVLYNQLYGIDVNSSALGIAAFSLYLAALELDEEPIAEPNDLRFEKLVNRTLFEADAITNLPAPIASRTFDAAVGNPPWTFVSQRGRRLRSLAEDSHPARPRRSPDQEFLATACELVKEKTGRIGMVMKATPFFSKDPQAVKARNSFLQRLSPAALVNLSSLRKEGLFPDATGPALVFFARCPLLDGKDRILVGSVPWTRDFRRNGIFQVGAAELHSVSLKRVIRNPALLKASTFGSSRDMLLIEKLQSSFPTLDYFLSEAGLEPLRSRGQGFQVKGGGKFVPPVEYRSLKVLTPSDYAPFRVESDSLAMFRYPTLHRPRSISIFRGPLLLCPRASFAASSELGRGSAAVSVDDVLYNKSFYGISFAKSQRTWAYVLSAILNSSLATFQFVFGGATWGLERPTVEPNDLLSLRVPDLRKIDSGSLDAAMLAERSAASSPNDRTRLKALDEAVFDLYRLDRDDRVIAYESLAKARAMIFDGRAKYEELASPPSEENLTQYAVEVVRTVNAFLRTRGTRHLEAHVYKQPQGESYPGAVRLSSVRFIMVPGGSWEEPVVHSGNEADFHRLMTILNARTEEGSPPYLNERWQIRVYGTNDVLMVKPAEIRYWTGTAGLNDGDVILADHWLSERHAKAV